MQMKYKLTVIFSLIIILVFISPSFASVDISSTYQTESYSEQYIHYNQFNCSYSNTYNNSQVWDNLSDNQTYSETNITSFLFPHDNFFVGWSHDHQILTNNITSVTATKATTAVWIYIINITNSSNFKNLHIYEKHGKTNTCQYNISDNHNNNISTILISPNHNISFNIVYYPTNQKTTTTEETTISYELLFDNGYTVYYRYYGEINIKINIQVQTSFF